MLFLISNLITNILLYFKLIKYPLSPLCTSIYLAAYLNRVHSFTENGAGFNVKMRFIFQNDAFFEKWMSYAETHNSYDISQQIILYLKGGSYGFPPTAITNLDISMMLANSFI